MQTTTESETYLIPEGKIEATMAKLAKINRRMAKHGCAPMTLTKTGTRSERIVVESRHGDRSVIDPIADPKFLAGKLERRGSRIVLRFFLVEFVAGGDAPKIAGWNLLGRIEHLGERNLVHSVPGLPVPAWAWTIEPKCDHCSTKRQRKDTFLVVDETGTVKQVARQCIKDYLGHKDAAAIAQIASSLWSFFEDVRTLNISGDGVEGYCDSNAMRGHVEIDAMELVTIAHAMVKHIGWTSGMAARENPNLTPTSASVGSYLWGNALTRKIFSDAGFKITEQDRTDAKAALEWVAASKPTSSYMENLKTMATLGWTTSRGMGTLVSLVVTYAKHIEREIQRSQREALLPERINGFLAEVKTRLTFEATITAKRFLEGNYGTTTMLRFVAETGHTVIWFASAEWATELVVGEKIKLTATVKKHDTYEDRDQTIIARAKIA